MSWIVRCIRSVAFVSVPIHQPSKDLHVLEERGSSAALCICQVLETLSNNQAGDLGAIATGSTFRQFSRDHHTTSDAQFRWTEVNHVRRIRDPMPVLSRHMAGFRRRRLPPRSCLGEMSRPVRSGGAQGFLWPNLPRALRKGSAADGSFHVEEIEGFSEQKARVSCLLVHSVCLRHTHIHIYGRR